MEEGRASETLRRRSGASATVMDAERLLSRGLPARSVRRSLGMVRKSFPGFSARRRRERASEATEARRTSALVTEMQWVCAGAEQRRERRRAAEERRMRSGRGREEGRRRIGSENWKVNQSVEVVVVA